MSQFIQRIAKEQFHYLLKKTGGHIMKRKEYCLSTPKQIHLEERNSEFKFHNSTTE
jgi:hypothetical protein